MYLKETKIPQKTRPMEAICKRLYPKIVLFTIFIFLNTICFCQQALNFESRKFKTSQSFTLEEIKDNIKYPAHLDTSFTDALVKKLDTLIENSIEQLSHGKFVTKGYGPGLVGDLDTLSKYIDKLNNVKKEYVISSKKDLSDPKNKNEYGKNYKNVVQSIAEFEKVIDLALKNQENTLASGIPEIDGLSSRLSPTMKIAGEFHVTNTIDISGNVFIGNNLNDETNKQVIYNPNSSTYGVNLIGSGNLIKSKNENFILAGNISSSFTEKSLFRDSTTSLSLI